MARRTATRSRRSRLRLAAVLAAIAVGIVAALAGAAFAGSTDTSATLSANVSLPTAVDIGSNGFTINVSASGTVPSSSTGQVLITTKYNMATDGTITASTLAADQQTLTFTNNVNYNSNPPCGSTKATSIQGCPLNPFVVNATLVVANGTPDGETGTLTVAGTGSSGISFDSTPATGYVTVSNPTANTAPTVETAALDANGTEGDLLSSSGAFQDSDGDTLTLSANNTVGTFTDNGDGTWTWSYQSTAPVPSGTITVTADDGHGNTVTDSFDYSATNVAPSLAWTTTGHPSTANEGDTKTYNFTITDPGTTETYSFVSGYPDCGTGGSLVANSASITGKSGTFQCSFPDGPASPTVSAEVTDGTDASTELTQAVTVANVAPTVNSVTVVGGSGTACIGGNSVTLSFNFSDPGVNDNPWSYDINWGDGSTDATGTVSSQGDVSTDASNNPITHTYAAGSYTPVVTVTDKDNGVGDSTGLATQPSVSFLYNVTGVLQPVNDTQAHQNPSVFKYGSTIPVKIEVTDCNATPVSGLSPQISVKKTIGSTPPTGTDETISSTSGADTGTTMRWSDPLYIYNLATKSLSDSSATYQITITGPFTTVTTLFGTKPK